MKKRILALLMALVMVFSFNTTYLADPGDSATVDNEQEFQEFNAEWLVKGGVNTWELIVNELPENQQLELNVRIYRDGEQVASTYSTAWYESAVSVPVHEYITESGEYYAEVSIYKVLENEYGSYYTEFVGIARSDAATYVKPNKTLATPENVAFSNDGKISFDTVEDADHYEVVINYYSVINGDGGCWNIFNVYAEGNEKTITIDYVKDYMDMWDIASDANYTVQVRAMSGDINVAQHSELSKESNVYKHKGTAKDLTVIWDEKNPTEIKIKNVADGSRDVDYYCYIYKNDSQVTSDSVWDETTEDVVFDISDVLKEWGPGEYKIIAYAYSYGENACVYKNELVINYNPTNKLAIPENVKLSDDGIITFDLVDGAESYVLFYYEENLGTGNIYYFPWSYFYPESGDTKGEIDITPFLDTLDEEEIAESCNDFCIKFGVMAVTKDITKKASSDTSWITVVEHKASKEQVVEKLDELLADEDASAAEVKSVLVNVSNDTLVELLKDKAFVEKIKTVEANYVKEMNINVVAPKSSVASVDASKITVVGAALNAGANADVQLTVSTPATKVTVPEKYKAGVQLDINLMVDGEALEDLSVPVTLTMPIPTGVDAKNLVILHYHGDATEPVVITPTVNADGTMTFTVTGFSTFVVTNLDTNAVKSPSTADTSVAVVCGMMLVAAAAVVVLRKRTTK